MSAVFQQSNGQADEDVARLRVPPHSIEAEQSVLGGLLLDNLAWDRAADLLTESDFYRYEHRQIYAAISALVGGGKPADVVTVNEHLQSLGRSEDCGGQVYLNALAQSVPSAANIRRYAEIVRERAVLRKLIGASDEIATQAFNPQGKPVTQILDEAEKAIFRIAEYARATVKVLLSGEGSDEIFAGYPKYAFEPRLAPFAAVPAFVRVPMMRAAERALPGSKYRARQALRALTGRDTAERLQTWFAPFTWYERRALRAGYGQHRSLGQYERCEGDHLRRAADAEIALILSREARAGTVLGRRRTPHHHRKVDRAFAEAQLFIRGPQRALELCVERRMLDQRADVEGALFKRRDVVRRGRRDFERLFARRRFLGARRTAHA